MYRDVVNVAASDAVYLSMIDPIVFDRHLSCGASKNQGPKDYLQENRRQVPHRFEWKMVGSTDSVMSTLKVHVLRYSYVISN